MRLAFLGAGKMATAIAAGLVQNEVFPTDDLQATDISRDARRDFTDATGVVCKGDAETVLTNADAVILAVKPQVAEEAVLALKGLWDNKLCISIAAGLPLDKLCEWFEHQRAIRVMPNTPLMVGLGASVFCCAPQVTTDDRELVHRIFGTVGIAHEMTEDKMDAVTALSGSGPAYIFEMVQAMVDGAEAVGLPADKALELTVQTVLGAATMLKKRLGTPDDLRRAVTSPGGTTAAGLEILNRNDFRQLIAHVIRAARDRSVELGR